MTVRLRHRCLCSARAVLERQVPALARSPQIGDARGFSLRSLKSYAPALLSDDALRGIDEELVPAANAIAYYEALHAAGVPVEMHVFERGRHGLGLAMGEQALGEWPMLLRNWMRQRGLLDPAGGG
jgi:acetyl esterase/lipase